MSNVKAIVLNDSDYRRLYDEQSGKIELLEGVLKYTVAEQIERDKLMIAELTKERDELRGRADEADKRVKDVEKAYESRSRQIERQIRSEKEQQLKDFKYNTNSKKIKPLEDENAALKSELADVKESLNAAEQSVVKAEQRVIEAETLLKSRDEEIERLVTLDKKLDALTELAVNSFDMIVNMLNNNTSKDVVIETVDKIKETFSGQSSVEDECIMIHQLLSEGKTQKEIANIMYPNISRKEQKVLDRKNSPTYKRLFS